jgi:hypothetical protein
VPQASPAPAPTAQVDLGGDAPRWASARGITGDEQREQELGSGKWSEETVGNLESVRRQMADRPVRDIDLEPSGPNWAMLGAAGVFVLGLIAWGISASMGGGETPDNATTATPPPPAKVQVEVNVPGAQVSLDGISYGPAPAQVPIPADDQPHQLCAEAEGRDRTCEEVTANRLIQRNPYSIRVP